jgi:hypothetical protein
MDAYGYDDFQSYLYINGIIYDRKFWHSNGNGGGGGRGAPLFPLSTSYENTSLNPITFTIRVGTTFGNDAINIENVNNYFIMEYK